MSTFAIGAHSERTNISAVVVQVMLQQGSGFRLCFQGSGLRNYLQRDEKEDGEAAEASGRPYAGEKAVAKSGHGGGRRRRNGANPAIGHRRHSLACAFGTASSCYGSTPHQVKNRVMGKSSLYRYKVYNVPFLLKPLFYVFSYFIALVLFLYALILHFTSKIEIVGQEHLYAQRNYIFCHWHTFIRLYGSVFLRNRSQVWMQHPFWFMKSIHLFLRFTGVKKIILGSTGHSGQQAADELVEYLKKGYSTVLLPDGPSGPAFVAKKGMLHIPSQSQVPIVAMQFKASKFFESHGWDRKKWPMPFPTIEVKFGTPILISENNIYEAYGEITKALG